MSYTLVCNEDNFLGLSTIDIADINWFNRNGIPPQNPKGAYWASIRGTGLNVKRIYDYLTNNGYTVPTYTFNLTNVKAAWDGTDPAAFTEFTEDRYWLVGAFDEGFGIGFSINGANQVYLFGFYYNPDNDDFRLEYKVSNTTLTVSSGSTDNICYFTDRLYDEGTLNNSQALGIIEGRYEVTVYEQLQREWYYYNNIDMVKSNGGDNPWSGAITRLCPYFTPSGGTASYNSWNEMAKTSPYSKRRDPYADTGGTSKPDGGGGNVRISDNIPLPTAPPDMLLNAGIVKIYKPTSQQMNDFINYIYSASTSIADNFKKIWNDPMQSIISLGIAPFDVPAADDTEVVRFCGVSTHVAMYPVASQFVTFDFGDLVLPEETVTFLDYASYTKVKVHLPFIGICDMNTDDVMNATLTLQYIIDLFTGDCVACIKCAKKEEDYKIDYDSTIYEFNGNVLAQSPITGNNYQGLYSGVLRAATTLFAGAMSGSVAGAAVSAGVDFLTSNKVNVKRSGSIVGNASHLGEYFAYLIVECPIPSTTTDMYERQGYPFNTIYSVKTMNEIIPDSNKPNIVGSGLTVFQKDSVFVDNIDATDAEKEMIKDILETGVIFNPHPKN